MNIEKLSEHLTAAHGIDAVSASTRNPKHSKGMGTVKDSLRTSALSHLMSASYRDLAAAHDVRTDRVQACLERINAEVPDTVVDTILQRMFGE